MFVEENIWSMFGWSWSRNIIGIVTSNNRLVICYRINNNMCRIYVVSLLEKEGGVTYDYSSKESS